MMEALAGLDQGGGLVALLDTGAGGVRCELDERRAPGAVALFVGLARGRARWRDPVDGRATRRPLYRDLAFHRVIDGVLVQTGCPVGDGTGHPGYRIPVETRADDREMLSRGGALVLARYTPPPGRADPSPPPAGHVLGSQFGVTLTDMGHLTGEVTVFGRCGDLDVLRRIAAVRDASTRPRLLRVRIVRDPR